MRVLLFQARFGPYHRARLRTARPFFAARGAELIGVQIASSDQYDWMTEETDNETLLTAFPSARYEDLSGRQIAVAVNKLLMEHDPECVVVNGYAATEAIGGITWCRARGRAVVVTSDSQSEAPDYNPAKEWLKRRIVALCDSAHTAGTSSARYIQLLGMAPARVHLGCNCVDNDLFASAHKEPLGRYFLVCSRLLARKNLPALVRAYAEYAQSVEDPWRLCIVGNGPEREDLSFQIRSMGVRGIELHGFKQISELPTIYRGASCFIHASRQDNWALVVNEAMASGLPVLVSRAAGCAVDLVREGINGWTFNPESASEMTELMRRVHHLPPAALAEMGRQSQAIISGWGLERFCTELWKAVLSAVAHAQTRPRGLRLDQRALMSLVARCV